MAVTTWGRVMGVKEPLGRMKQVAKGACEAAVHKCTQPGRSKRSVCECRIDTIAIIEMGTAHMPGVL